MNLKNPFEDVPIIHSYSRAQAIEDGVLVDLTAWARETGFTIPVACTRAVWDRYVAPPDGTESLGQSERGRAHDLLWMLFNAIRRGDNGDCLHFSVIFLQAPKRHETATFKAICGPGDKFEPVITVMLEEED